MGEFITTVAGLFPPVYDPSPVPNHDRKMQTKGGGLAVAVICTDCPASKKPDSGVTMSGPGSIFRKCCVVKFAV
jgi:hypothetical protein